jgi:hypothetical protein
MAKKMGKGNLCLPQKKGSNVSTGVFISEQGKNLKQYIF